MTHELTDKIALVTGADRGIGLAIAKKLASMGATIAGATIDQTCADTFESEFKNANLKGKAFIMNVGDSASVESAMKKIIETFGAPNILVNNAGIARDNLMLRMSDDEWNSVINVNLNSVFRLSKACLRDMVKARWGRIINIASVVGVIGNAGQANYAAAKAGIIAFGKSLAQEVASRNITVNSIAPGFIESDMTKKLTQEQRENFLKIIPMKSIGTPDDVANAVAFLVSSSANYITGTTLHVNGGMFMS